MALYSSLNIFVLSTLFVTGVFDAREHRIPNVCVLLIFVFSLVMKLVGGISGVSILQDFSIGCLYFLFGFILFLLRAMAPGDVKLLGVVGFFLGWNYALLGALYISVAMMIVGVFYYFYFRAQTYHPPVLSLAKDYFSHAEFSVLSVGIFIRQCYGVNLDKSDNQIKNRMPFAPVVVLGVSLFQHYVG